MAVLRLAHFGVAASVAFTLLVIYVSSAYLTALRLSRKDSFLLELRVPDLQVTEAVLLTIIILLLVWNQTLQDLGLHITCFMAKLASALITSVLLGSFIFRAVRVKVLSHSRRRKRFGKYMSPRAMRIFMVLMAIYGLGLLGLEHRFDLCGSELCQPRGVCVPFADWYLMGPHVLACVVVLLILGVTESNLSVHDPLQLNLENRQVGTTAFLGAVLSFCFITLIDTGVVRGEGARILSLFSSIALIVSFVFIFLFSGLLPAMRFGYSPFPGLGRSLSIGVEHARGLKEQQTLAGIRLIAKNKREKSGWLGGRAVGGSTRSVMPAPPVDEPTSKRYMSLRDELFQVLSEKETRLLFFDFCARLMCEEHAQFVYEYHRLTSERGLSSTERHVSLQRMLKLIKDYVARDGMYAMGMSVHMSQSLTLHAATLHAAQHKPSEPRLLEVQDTLSELFALVLTKLVNSTFVEFREHPPYVDYLTTLAIAARRRHREATHGDSGRHSFNVTSEFRPSDLDKTLMGADDESNVVNMAHVVEEGYAPAGNRVEGGKEEVSSSPPPQDPRSAKARQNELLLHLAQSGNLSKGFKRSLRRMDSDIKAQLNAPRETPGEDTAELLRRADRRGMGASYGMFNSWRIGAAKARRSTSEQRSSVSEGRDSRDW